MARSFKVVQKITKSVTKHGKIKGHNKKETKLLKGICPHHRVNKKGKQVPTIYNNGDYCICTMCGEKFPADFYQKDEYKNILRDVREMNNQAKFMAVATNSGEKTVSYFCQFGGMLSSYSKMFKRVTHVAAKQGSVKSKKKKHNNGSNQYGSWGQRR